MRFGQRVLHGQREMGGRAVAETGDPQHHDIGEPLREDGLGGHHHPHELGVAGAPIPPAPGQRDNRTLGARQQSCNRRRILVQGPLTVDRRQYVARPEPDDGGRAVPHDRSHLDQRAALANRQAQTRPTGPLRSLLARLNRWYVARIRIETAEHLVEEALDDTLHSRASDGWRNRKARGCQDRGGFGP